MAATEPRALRALTAAALALPGLTVGPETRAEGNGASLDYHHYVEGKRDLEGRTYKSLNLCPIEVDSFAFALRYTAADR